MGQRISQTILLLLILASFTPSILILFFVKDLGFNHLLSVALGYAGFVSLWWGYMLGMRRLVGQFVPDLTWVNNLHKWLSILGFLVLLGHPVLMIIENSWKILIPRFESTRQLALVSGMLGLLAWGIVWVTSAILRGRLEFRAWKRLHILVYPIMFLVFFHLQVGRLAQSSLALTAFNWTLFISFALVVLWQALGRIGVGVSKYVVAEKKFPAQHTVSLLLRHVSGDKLEPRPGQYIYVQAGRASESHPFSISNYRPDDGDIEITVKNLGHFSEMMQTTPVSTELIVDGPYGDFLHNFDKHNGDIVFVAGGIGIVPFASLLRSLRYSVKDPAQRIFVFHGSRTIRDTAFDQELQKLESEITDFDIITVLDQEPRFAGEQGYINVGLLQKYVSNLQKATFFLCTPPELTKQLNSELRQAGVRQQQIFIERFNR